MKKEYMKDEYKVVFEGLGYNVKSKGAMFFGDLIGDVRELLKEGKTEEEIKELLPRYYVEYYHFCYEVGSGRIGDTAMPLAQQKPLRS